MVRKVTKFFYSDYFSYIATKETEIYYITKHRTILYYIK